MADTSMGKFEKLGLRIVGRIDACLRGELDESYLTGASQLLYDYLNLMREIKLSGPRVDELLIGLLICVTRCVGRSSPEILPAYIVRAFLNQRDLGWLIENVRGKTKLWIVVIPDGEGGRVLVASREVTDLVEALDADGLVKLGAETVAMLGQAQVPISFLLAKKRGVSQDEIDVEISAPLHRYDCTCGICRATDMAVRVLQAERRTLGNQIIALCHQVLELDGESLDDLSILATFESVLDGYLRMALTTDICADPEEVAEAICRAADVIFTYDENWSRLWIDTVTLLTGKSYVLSMAQALDWSTTEDDGRLYVHRIIHPVSDSDELQFGDAELRALLERARLEENQEGESPGPGG